MTSGRIITEIKYLEVRDMPGGVVHVLSEYAFPPMLASYGTSRQEVRTEAVRIPESGVAAIRSVHEEWPQVFGAVEENQRLRGENACMARALNMMPSVRIERDRYRKELNDCRRGVLRIAGMNIWQRLKWVLKPKRSK